MRLVLLPTAVACITVVWLESYGWATDGVKDRVKVRIRSVLGFGLVKDVD